jgi:proteasome lid subunit RPN8/RPN11
VLIIPTPLMRRIIDAVEAAYPNEGCGLLIGCGGPRRARVTRVLPSANLAEDPRAGFEVDPALRFQVMRSLLGSKEYILGHYHSHPDCAQTPSARDLAMAYEPEFFWLITSVFQGQALMTSAYRLDAVRARAVNVSLSLG